MVCKYFLRGIISDYFSILHQYNTIRIYNFIRMMCDQDNRHSLFLIQFFHNIYYFFS